MDNMSNFGNVNIPKIVIKDSETKHVSGAICVGTDQEVRVAFIEEKLVNDEFGNVEMVRQSNTQIVMTPEVARNIIDVIQQNLNSR